MRLSDFPRRVGPLSDDVRCLFQTLRDITDRAWFLAEHCDPYVKQLIANGTYDWDRREEFKTRVKAEMLVSLRVNPGAIYHAIYSSTDADVKWFEDHMEPACREALELARREADDPSWIDGFFQRAQGDYLICWYARWHPESGLSIPTREQWDDFLEELKSKGVDY